MFTVVLTELLAYFTNRTRLGAAIKATSFDVDAARLVGIDVDHIYAVTFAVGVIAQGDKRGHDGRASSTPSVAANKDEIFSPVCFKFSSIRLIPAIGGQCGTNEGDCDRGSVAFRAASGLT